MQSWPWVVSLSVLMIPAIGNLALADDRKPGAADLQTIEASADRILAPTAASSGELDQQRLDAASERLNSVTIEGYEVTLRRGNPNGDELPSPEPRPATVTIDLTQ